LLLSAAIVGAEAEKHSAVVPPHHHNWCAARHLAVNARVKQGNVTASGKALRQWVLFP